MSYAPQRAVVFGYHDVGVRGLSVLLANGVDVRLVVTHDDDPDENIWFGSVAELAALNDIPVITPKNPNSTEVIAQIAGCEPEWFFSFYYRRMLQADLLALPKRGAYNMHGSLLPKYRGRAPVNWAVLHGESETGASLHRMELKPDAGALVDQESVPILSNDTAFEVFQKVTVAAERVLVRSIPTLLSGKAKETPLDLDAGSYFGRRRPDDGRINWSATAWEVHNLIRAVAPPYPGAFFDIQSLRVHVFGSYFRGESSEQKEVRIYWRDGRCWVDCADGKRLCLKHIAIDGDRVDERAFTTCFGAGGLKVL